MAGFWPLLSMYLAETSAVRLCNMMEKIQTTSSINALAWSVTTELDTWFECECRDQGPVHGMEYMPCCAHVAVLT